MHHLQHDVAMLHAAIGATSASHPPPTLYTKGEVHAVLLHMEVLLTKCCRCDSDAGEGDFYGMDKFTGDRTV
jgi:hypothetical protein